MASTPSHPGAVVGGRYVLVEILGQGAMGIVWAARDVLSEAMVAIKFIKDDAGDPAMRRLWLAEAETALKVRHPNVVEVMESLSLGDDQPPALVMELLRGEPLAVRLHGERRLTLTETAALLLPVVSAVGAAHALGIVHRDLKPENIFVARSPAGEAVVKVLDFGIAKRVHIDEETARAIKSTTTLVIGTPQYMSPEQLLGERDVDHRADIWALGLILYQCLSGALPTAAENVGQVIKRVVVSRLPFTSLRSLVPGLPGEVSGLVERMLSRERERRTVDLHEVLDVLRPYASVAVPDFGPPPRRTAPPTPLESEFPDDSSANSASRRPERRWPPRRAGVAALIAVLAIAGGAGSRWLLRAAPPLREPSSILACPILRVSGAAEPSGWLGGAAASVVCERARVLLGGRAERTLLPAELLSLPPQPADRFPADPFGASEARERSIEAARRRANAYIDGEVVVVPRQPPEFHVTLELHGQDRAVLGRATGQGPGLHEALRAGVEPLIAPSLIPKAGALDPGVAEWTRTGDVDAALALLDVTLGLAMNAGALDEDCKRFAAHDRDIPEMGPIVRWICAYTLGHPLPPSALGAPSPSLASRSPAALAAAARASHLVTGCKDDPAITETLRAALQREPTPLGRSVLAATLSCLLQSTDPKGAMEMAFRSVQSDPKNPLGEFCVPWGQLMTLTQDNQQDDRMTTLRAMQSWVPWDSNAWRQEQDTPAAGVASADLALAYARRAYLLSPFDTTVTDVFVDKLLTQGAPQDARNVALATATGRAPVHRLEAELLHIRIAASQGQLQEAYRRTESAMRAAPDEGGWALVLRMEIVWQRFELARILGRGREVANDIVTHLVLPEPPPFDSVADAIHPRVVALCAAASPALSARCFERYRVLRGRLSCGLLPKTDDFVAGAEAWARGDRQAAARAWRRLSLTGQSASTMPETMVEVFESGDDDERVERLEAEALAQAGRYHGANLVLVQVARRASRQHDLGNAGKLAKRVIDAWKGADEKPPVVDEMRALLGKLQ